jgi:5-deoxy-glucuronate isomerase
MLKSITPETCIARRTHERKGRSLFVSPENAATRWLHYGRINLDGGDDAEVAFSTEALETVLVNLRGEATVRAAGRRWDLHRYDAVYLPPNFGVSVTPGGQGCDLAEIAARVDGHYEPAFVSFADVRRDPALHFRAGGPAASRELNIIVGKNVEAGRLLAGVTFSEPGNWTSWPPHEHGDMLEEAYLYIDMPAPAFAVQLVYVDTVNPEFATIVREGDCVIIPQGYHPNVAVPGSRTGFLWFMAAHRERVDRQFGVVNVQPEFATKGSGLEAARK